MLEVTLNISKQFTITRIDLGAFMYLRLVLFSLFMFFLTMPASAAGIYQLQDGAFDIAAAKIKANDYKSASEAALKAPPGGVRDFLLGMTATKMGNWQIAAEQLGNASRSFPLLGDFALYNQAYAFCKLHRYQESVAVLQNLFKNYPNSPPLRSAKKLLPDVLYQEGAYPDALAAYQQFIEKYPSGSDAVSALYSLAMCQERTGDLAGAAITFRNIWLNYPASTTAGKAEADMRRLAEKGIRNSPFTAEEILRRGVILYGLRKYDMAIAVFNAIHQESQTKEFNWRLMLKTGQAQFKARRFKVAEQIFSKLLAQKPKMEIAQQASFWMARCLDKNGKEEEAYRAFLSLTETYPDSPLADDALLDAAFLRKFQHNTSAELEILKKFLDKYPQSKLAQNALWEISWGSYQNGDFRTAAEFFKKQLSIGKMRERALYWYAHALAASGDLKASENIFATLTNEFPLGYYALSHKKEAHVKEDYADASRGNLCDILPVPTGFERAKTLIALGLYVEAHQDLAACRAKASGNTTAMYGLARLYLEMGDYHGAFSLFNQPRRLEKGSILTWNLMYPLAYKELVSQNSVKCNIDESLIYSIIRAESNFSPTACSSAGAIGLMQLMPATAAKISSSGAESNVPGILSRPEFNIRYGVKHLKNLLVLFDGDIVKAVAAYNAGSGNVSRWLKTLGDEPNDQFVENIPYTETREYVKKVLAGAEIYNRLYKLCN